jgi:hypothetical protein
MKFARALAAAMTVACLAACSSKNGDGDGDGGPHADGAQDSPLEGCAALTGNRFASVSMLECGAGSSCYWHVSFEVGGTFYWQHSDYGESGTYVCNGNDVTGNSNAGRTIPGRWTPASARLTWGGQEYKLEAPLGAAR